MSTHDGPAMRVILFMGVTTFLVLMGLSVGLRQSLKPNPLQKVDIDRGQTAFDGREAMTRVETMAAFGARPTGSDALARCRQWIVVELEKAGLRPEIREFEADTPLGLRSMANIHARTGGSEDGSILLTTGYDTVADFRENHPGANSAASGAAVLLELARVLGPARNGKSIRFVFLEGQERVRGNGLRDGLAGARNYVNQLRSSRKLNEIEAAINLYMVGDCYLGLSHDPNADAGLLERIWSVAETLGYGQHFLSDGRLPASRGHEPFAQAGIPSLTLVDFSYGGSLAQHVDYYHTAADTPSQVCWESLQAVGDVLYDGIDVLETYIDNRRDSGS